VRLVARTQRKFELGGNEWEAGKGGPFIAKRWVVEHCGETRCNDFVSFMAKASFDHVDVVAGP